MITSDLN